MDNKKFIWFLVKFSNGKRMCFCRQHHRYIPNLNALAEKIIFEKEYHNIDAKVILYYSDKPTLIANEVDEIFREVK